MCFGDAKLQIRVFLLQIAVFLLRFFFPLFLRVADYSQQQGKRFLAVGEFSILDPTLL